MKRLPLGSFVFLKTMKHNKAHTQQVRIIGGTHRRRIVHFNEAEGLRPTPDRVREQVFNWLGQRLHGLRVLDVFGGSGVMAFEAASRGAEHVDVVELNRQSAQVMRENVRQLQLEHVFVHHQDALRFLQAASKPYDVIFLDPPYRWQDWGLVWADLIKLSHEDSMIYIEASQLPELPSQLVWHKQGSAGQSHYGLAMLQSIDL